jgi:hypothetical protein
MVGEIVPKTSFRPETSGFAFVNSWKYDASERERLRAILSSALGRGLDILRPKGGGSLAFRLGDRVAGWIASVIPEGTGYGLCGGMAYAAADYYRAGLVAPQETNDQPRWDTPQGADLRGFMWRRLVESMYRNAAQVLAWMVMLHLLPKERPFYGGPPWLRDKSREHFHVLKGHIDAGEPWPILLMGENPNPFSNHVVLAYGYEDAGNGEATIYIYDPNCPVREHTVEVDFRGERLEARESFGNRMGWTPVRGFFCYAYTPVTPPLVWQAWDCEELGYACKSSGKRLTDVREVVSVGRRWGTVAGLLCLEPCWEASGAR